MGCYIINVIISYMIRLLLYYIKFFLLIGNFMVVFLVIGCILLFGFFFVEFMVEFWVFVFSIIIVFFV